MYFHCHCYCVAFTTSLNVVKWIIQPDEKVFNKLRSICFLVPDHTPMESTRFDVLIYVSITTEFYGDEWISQRSIFISILSFPSDQRCPFAILTTFELRFNIRTDSTLDSTLEWAALVHSLVHSIIIIFILCINSYLLSKTFSLDPFECRWRARGRE